MKKLLTFITLSLLTWSCARVSSPTGGPIDETPPILLSSVPENQQTNFQSNIITLVFNEWVTTKNIETDLIITPKIQSGFKTRVKKDQIQLTFNEPFKDSTTYTLSFASTITDITNNNPIVGLTLSFATGSVLDSLNITGNITNLYEQEPAQEFLVSLYTEKDSLNILDGAASYYTKTDTLGDYKFQNLPLGKYRIYAVNDKNTNSKADTENERYGFYKDTLNLSQSISDIDFTVQNLNVDKIRINNGRPYAHYYDIETNKTIKELEIVENNSQNKSYNRINSKKFRFYNQTNTFNDTTQLIVNLIDSAGTTLTDTLNYYFIQSKLDREEFKLSIGPSTGLLKPSDSLVFTFTKPVNQVNTDSIYFEMDSINKIGMDPTLIVWNKYQDEFRYPVSNEELFAVANTNTILTLLPTSFISIEGDTLSKQDKNLSPIKEEDIASIEGQIFTQSESILVQLLDGRTKNVLEESRQKQYKFEYISPGRYLVRVIHDINGNGQWDTGNILQNLQPEPVYYYFDDFYKTRQIDVRKRWETTDINISF